MADNDETFGVTMEPMGIVMFPTSFMHIDDPRMTADILSLCVAIYSFSDEPSAMESEDWVFLLSLRSRLTQDQVRLGLSVLEDMELLVDDPDGSEGKVLVTPF